ncbi:MAG: RNA pseudouridine synthase [Treponema sp.]|nr:RNA pseudouridine synthase [Treponema sp.]
MILIQNRILYQSSTCIVINKLKGEAAQGAQAAKTAQGKKDDIVNLPKELAKILNVKRDLIQPAHRIDVPVTGCVLFALTKPALTFLFNAFADKINNPIKKKYWAIVEKPDVIPAQNAQLVHWIETNIKINKSFVYEAEGENRKKAVLNYKVIGEGTNYLFLEVELFSGRHHQIRAQLAAIGLYIKGDVKYGARRGEKDGGIRLHARYLSFPDPLNPNEKINITADPHEIDNLWKEFILFSTTNHTNLLLDIEANFRVVRG